MFWAKEDTSSLTCMTGAPVDEHHLHEGAATSVLLCSLFALARACPADAIPVTCHEAVGKVENHLELAGVIALRPGPRVSDGLVDLVRSALGLVGAVAAQDVPPRDRRPTKLLQDAKEAFHTVEVEAPKAAAVGQRDARGRLQPKGMPGAG